MLLCGLVLQAACPRAPTTAPPLEDRREAAQELERFQQVWLEPAHIAPLRLDTEPRRATVDGLTGEARPVRPEHPRWNRWEDGPRLFNDRLGLFFHVRVQGSANMRWVPEQTVLALNQGRVKLGPEASPEEALHPLLAAALLQERSGLEGDLVDRTRGAGAFRAAYLPHGGRPGQLEGLILFPLPDPLLQITQATLELTVEIDGAFHTLSWSFD